MTGDNFYMEARGWAYMFGPDGQLVSRTALATVALDALITWSDVGSLVSDDNGWPIPVASCSLCGALVPSYGTDDARSKHERWHAQLRPARLITEESKR